MKKILIIIILTVIFGIGGNLKAQVSQLIIGVDGFTCSLCAKGVEAQFKSLDFVKSVKTDLKNTLFTLTLKSNTSVNVSQINDAVKDGGFSVRDIRIEATGTLKGDPNSGFMLVSMNAPDIYLNDIKGDLSNGDKVFLKGKVNTNSNTVSVTSIKKI